MASGNEMRVGDAEREATAAELREHYASGRLTLEELNERLDKAFAAKTRGDLNALLVDLPSARPGTAGSTGRDSQGPGWGSAGGRGTGTGQAGQRAGQAGRRAGSAVAAFVMMNALLLFGLLELFGLGFGHGRPLGIVLIFMAFTLLKRLLFGRRRGARACGPRRRRW
jgi:hypothetical protein